MGRDTHKSGNIPQSGKSRWKRFVSWVTFWLERKAIAADEYADAVLDLKKAEAAKIWAECKKAEAETSLTKMEIFKMALEINQRVESKNVNLPKAISDGMKELFESGTTTNSKITGE